MSDFDDISEIENTWETGCPAMIPEKSKLRYEKTYAHFKNWCDQKYGGIVDEKMLLDYFVMRNDTLKAPGSLWAEYSMLKSTIFLKDAIDISKFFTLIAYLKKKSAGHRPKKSGIFSREHIKKFLNEAPDNEFLSLKVALILGIAGACRREELYNMTIDDIEEHEKFVVVKIPNIENNIQRSFTVTNELDEGIHYTDFLKKYIALRPMQAKGRNLFLNYRNGKCSVQVVGRGTIGSWPAKIAKYLGLEDSQVYTGHSFRRTSATLLANKGVDILAFKPHRECKSSKAAAEDASENKIEFAEEIIHNGASTSATSDSVNFAPDGWEKGKVDGKRKLTHNAVPTIFSLDYSTEAISDELSNFAEDETDNGYHHTEPNIENGLVPEKIEKILKTEIVEPVMKEGEAILVEPSQKVILPNIGASTVRILNTPVNIKNSSTLLKAVKTLDISKLSKKPNDSWFTKAATAVSRINTSLSYSITELDKAKSRATNAEELALIHNKLQETLSGSINSLIQIRKNLRSDFIVGIKNTKLPPDTASDTKEQNVIILNKGIVCSGKKRKLPDFTLNPATGLMTQKQTLKMRIVQVNSTATTSHTTPAISHTTPATSNTTPATSHAIPTTSHTKTKGYLKVRSFRQLQNVPSSYINLPEVTNKAEKDPPKDDEYNIDNSENSEDKVYEPEKPPSNFIADNVTNRVGQMHLINTLQIEHEGSEYAEISDESEDKKNIVIEHNEIGMSDISEEKVGSISEQNELEDLSRCDENFIGKVEVKSEPEEDLHSVESCSTLDVVNVQGLVMKVRTKVAEIEKKS